MQTHVCHFTRGIGKANALGLYLHLSNVPFQLCVGYHEIMFCIYTGLHGF